LCLALAAIGQGIRTNCKDLSYEDRNQTDYGPLQISRIRGIAQDAQGGPIPKACAGIFTETDHKLIAVTETDEDGHFELDGIRDGDYRLMVKDRYKVFCPAHAMLRVKQQTNGTWRGIKKTCGNWLRSSYFFILENPQPWV
jgi:hypothetical protein